MKLDGWVAKVKDQRTILLIIIALAISVLFVWQYWPKPKPSVGPAQSLYGITDAQLLAGHKQGLNKDLNNKEYTAAAVDFLAYSATLGDKNPKQALSVLQDGVKKLPNQYISWDYYSAMAALAKQTGNKKAEKDSLNKAIAKAEPAGSDNQTPPALIQQWRSRLKDLNTQ